MLTAQEFWHDHMRHYPATDGLTAEDILLFPEWSQRTPDRTPTNLLTEEVPDDDEVLAFAGQEGAVFNLLALSLFFEEHGIATEPTLDVVYCLRPRGL